MLVFVVETDPVEPVSVFETSMIVEYVTAVEMLTAVLAREVVTVPSVAVAMLTLNPATELLTVTTDAVGDI